MSQRTHIEIPRLSDENLTKGRDANVDSQRSDCCYQLMLNSLWTWLRNRIQSHKKITAPASQTERLFS